MFVAEFKILEFWILLFKEKCQPKQKFKDPVAGILTATNFSRQLSKLQEVIIYSSMSIFRCLSSFCSFLLRCSSFIDLAVLFLFFSFLNFPARRRTMHDDARDRNLQSNGDLSPCRSILFLENKFLVRSLFSRF